MRRALVILLGAVLLALVLAVTAAVFVAATESGTRFLAGQAERYLPIELTDVSGALLGEVRVGRLVYTLPDQRLEIDGLATSVEMMPLLFDNHLVVHTVSADAVVLTATGTPAPAEGPAPELELPYLPLTIDVAALRLGRLELPGAFPMSLEGGASWNGEGLTVRRLAVVSEFIVGNVQGRLGTGSNPTVSARVNWSLPSRAWGGQGSIEGRVRSFALQHTLRGFVSVDAEGTGDLSNLSEPALDVDVTVDDLEFGGTAIRDISGHASGTLANVRADLGARVAAPAIEPFDVRVVAYGPPVTGPLTFRNVSANALDGTQEGQGSVSWQDAVRVVLGGTITDVSLAALRDGVEGRASSEFRFLYQDDLLEIGLENLAGELNGRPVDGTVAVARTAGGWRFEPVRLNVGDNALAGSGNVDGAAVDVQAELTAPSLEALGFGVAGDARGKVALSGAWPDLSGRIELTSDRLEGFDATLEDTSLDADLTDGRLQATLTATGASRRALSARDARVELDGDQEHLDWRLRWAGGEGAGSLERRADALEIQLTDARMTLLDETWSLEDPTRVVLAGERIEAAPVCVAGGGASACMEAFTYQGGSVETRGTLTRAPVALLQPWLPVRLGPGGYAEGHWRLEGQPDDLSGEIAVAARGLTVQTGDEDEVVELPDLEADGDVADGALKLRLAATDQDFSLEGDVDLAPVSAAGELTGTLDVAVADLTPLKVFDQRIETLEGGLDGSLSFSGTPAAPRMDGRLHLSGGRVQLSDPGLALSDIDVQARLDDSGTFDVRGTAMQKEQDVLLTASGSGLFDSGLAFEAALKADAVRVRQPDWEISVSPDLRMTYSQGRGRLQGRLEVPRAEVRLNSLPASVPGPSEDVVVVGQATQQNGGEQTGWLRADVDVVLGDDVTLKALGITAELQGELQARLDAKGRTTLRGTLDVTGGVLSTQGQTLTIESGTVVYNGPVTRPYIDIRAVRVIEDVTPAVKVGLHIRGDANNLTSSVFSEPAMSETRALSFLVLGRDIQDETAQADSSQLLTAAINLGLSRSKGITSELKRLTGLDELSAMAEAQNSFAIVAGKRVTDDLYVRYTYNTLSAVGAFLVRYDITRKWQLEAHSGEQSAMDLLYSIQK